MIEHWFGLSLANCLPSGRIALFGKVLVCIAIGSNLALSSCAFDEYSRSSSKVQSTAGVGTTAPDTTARAEVTSGGTSGDTSNDRDAGGEVMQEQGGAPASAVTSASSAGAATTTGATVSAGAPALASATAGTTSGGRSMVTLAGARIVARSVVDAPMSGVAGAQSVITLKDAAAARQLWIGAAMASHVANDTEFYSVAASEFNYLTPENDMKWSVTEPSPNTFNFAGGDELVAFAQAHQMRVKGHTLVWHSQLPIWVQTLSTADEVRRAMTNHIQTVAEHYQGKLAAWDVVNEAIDDNSGNPLRATVFQQKLGSTYIDEAFRIAHQADPNALLFYNDYGIEGMGSKANAAYDLVKRLKTSGVPIDGVGLQMHIAGTGSPSAVDVIANMKRIAQLGLLVNISEMDVSLCPVTGDESTKFAVQEQRYREIVAACVAEPMCHAITFWGISDKYSWLNTAFPCTKAGESGSPWALPWDGAYVRKPAWNGILGALLGN